MIKIKMNKCEFINIQIYYLGQLIYTGWVSPFCGLEAIKTIHASKNIKKMDHFLDYHNHSKNYTDTKHILLELLKTRISQCQVASEHLK